MSLYKYVDSDNIIYGFYQVFYDSKRGWENKE